MNQHPFYTEPLAEPIESDAVGQLYLFQERAAIHVFDGGCTHYEAECLARGDKVSLKLLWGEFPDFDLA